jgi:hypothetical protein
MGVFDRSVYFPTLKMEAVYPSKTLGNFYETTLPHIPEGNVVRHENLKCHRLFLMRFEVLTTVIIKITVFGDVTLHSSMHLPDFVESSHRKLFFWTVCLFTGHCHLKGHILKLG